MRHFLLNQGGKIALPTAIPYIFHDKVMHPIYDVWTSRLICKWCDGGRICGPDERLTSVTPATSRWLRQHMACDEKGRAKLRREQGRDTLRRELGTTHFHKGL